MSTIPSFLPEQTTNPSASQLAISLEQTIEKDEEEVRTSQIPIAEPVPVITCAEDPVKATHEIEEPRDCGMKELKIRKSLW